MIQFSDLFDDVIFHIISFLHVEEIAIFLLLCNRFNHLGKYHLHFVDRSLLVKWKRTHDLMIKQGAIGQKPTDAFFDQLFLPNEGLLIQTTDHHDMIYKCESYHVGFYSSFGACLSFEMSKNEILLHKNYHYCPTNKLLIYHFGDFNFNCHVCDVVFDLNDLSTIEMKNLPIFNNGMTTQKSRAEKSGRCQKCYAIIPNKNELLPPEELWTAINFTERVSVYAYVLKNEPNSITAVYYGNNILYQNGQFLRFVDMTNDDMRLLFDFDSEHLFVGGSKPYIINVLTDKKYEFPRIENFAKFLTTGPFLLLRQHLQWFYVIKSETGFSLGLPTAKKCWMVAYCPQEKRLLHFCLIPNNDTI